METRPLGWVTFWPSSQSRPGALASSSVCISRREYPSITFRNSIEIQMEVYNSQDIQQYIDQKLDLAAVLPEDATGLRSAIAERANGIFLWVVLAVEGILKDLESGTNIKRIINRTKSLPKELEDLFAQILDGMDSDQLQMALRLFQWAVLPTDRLRIREWHHILAFLREEPFCSLREWRESEHYTETDAQLERQIRHLSRGLIEVKAGIDVSDPSAEVASLLAGAGSLDSTTGDSRVVQPIHETVVEFLTSGRANALFKQAPEYDFIGNGHLAIATACLDYIKISKFDDLFAARERYFQAPGSQSGPSSSNPPLFGTAPASQSGPSSSIPPLFGTVRRRRSATSFMSSASSHSETNAFDKAKPFEDTMWEHNWKDDWKDEPKDERRDEWPGIDVQASPWDGQGVLSWGQLSQRSLNSWTSQDQWFREQLGAAQGAQHESTAGRSEPASLPEPETKLTPATVGEEQALADNPLWISSLPSRFGAPEPPAPSTGFPWPRVQDDSKPRGPESPISSNISQTLQEYPALASYALNRVFAHAQGGHARGADPVRVMKKLVRGGCWNRWYCLQEGVVADKTLGAFLEAQGLGSWMSSWRTRRRQTATTRRLRKDSVGCDPCRIRMRRCDGEMPCQNCTRTGLVCAPRKQNLVRCDLCTDVTFSRADALTRHYRVCHPDVAFQGKQRRRSAHRG